MRLGTTAAAAAVLAAAMCFPLAGVAAAQDLDCANFQTQAEAQAVYNSGTPATPITSMGTTTAKHARATLSAAPSTRTMVWKPVPAAPLRAARTTARGCWCWVWSEVACSPWGAWCWLDAGRAGGATERSDAEATEGSESTWRRAWRPRWLGGRSSSACCSSSRSPDAVDRGYRRWALTRCASGSRRSGSMRRAPAPDRRRERRSAAPGHLRRRRMVARRPRTRRTRTSSDRRTR